MDWLWPHFAFLGLPAGWSALVTLIVMEIVLGIDNLIFISILTNKLPAERQKLARRTGITAALVLRLVLLALISAIVQLTQPVFTRVRPWLFVARPHPDRRRACSWCGSRRAKSITTSIPNMSEGSPLGGAVSAGIAGAVVADPAARPRLFDRIRSSPRSA